MKALVKTETPAVLRKNERAWNDSYVEAAAESSKNHEKWRHPDIKAALRTETDSKCAYCEARIEDVSFSHVEHLLPKSKFPELSHSWSNLTMACEVCNVAKGDYFIEDCACLNPYLDHIPDFVAPIGPFIDWAAGDARAEITVKKIRLNRSALVQARAERIASVRELYERWFESVEPLRSVLAEAIVFDVLQGEFTYTVETFLRSKNFPIGLPAES